MSTSGRAGELGDFLSEHVVVIPVTMPAPVLRHEPTDDCDGRPVPRVFGNSRCVECGARLCSCELAYGHDCE